MARTNDKSGTPVQIGLPELLSRYLQRQLNSHGAGLIIPAATGEVVLYEAAPVQSVDPRLAWDEALAAIRFYQPKAHVGSCAVPPEWASLVTTQEPIAALPLCVGNFPQLVRSLQPMLRTENLAELLPTAKPESASPSIAGWAEGVLRKKDPAEKLLALGVLRLAGLAQTAASFLSEHRTGASADWQAAFANEEASLAWNSGRADEAAALWQAQADSTPVFFNRGMAALFLNRAADARSSLHRAVSELPEDSGWHHLGRLYLALAEMRD